MCRCPMLFSDHTCSERNINACVYELVKLFFLLDRVDCANFCSIRSIFPPRRAIFSAYRAHFCLKVDFDESSFISIKKTTQDVRALAFIHTHDFFSIHLIFAVIVVVLLSLNFFYKSLFCVWNTRFIPSFYYYFFLISEILVTKFSLVKILLKLHT